MMKSSVGAGAAVAAGLVLAAGLAIDSRDTLAAYLVAWIAFGAIPIGALCVLMTTYLVRRAWTEALHPILRAATMSLPAVAVWFIPVLVGMRELYPAAADPTSLPPFKAIYLAPWFFALRSIVYFLIWTALALWLRRAWGDSERMTPAASAGLIVYALTTSLAGIDWIESLEPDFHSSIYGLLYLSFALLSGLAFAIFGSLLNDLRFDPRAGYGALLLSTILLWAYLHAMQYIVIWAGDIPDEVVWYLKRSEHGWQFMLVVLAIGQFVFPFFALLKERVRTDRSCLLASCALTLVMRVCEAAILILPGIEHLSPVTTAIMLLAALVFVGIILFWAIDTALGRAAAIVNPPASSVRGETGRRPGGRAR
jgi:hypothetical protein